MKLPKIILTIILSVAVSIAVSEKQQIKGKSQLKECEIFLNGAQLTSYGTANLVAGVNDVIFENAPLDLDENTIQVKGEGDFTILSVARKVNYLNEQNKPKLIKSLEDTLEKVQAKYNATQNLLNALNYEEKMIIANQSMGGSNSGVSVAELQKMADFFRSRLTEIANKKQDLQAKQKILNEEVIKLNQQLQEQGHKRKQGSSDIFVTVLTKAATSAKFTINYFTRNVSWSPFYEIKANDSNDQLNVSAKANVYQNTGIDWERVKLTLSTGNPTIGNTKPTLYPWRLQFYDPVMYGKPAYMSKSKNVRSLESLNMSVMPENQEVQLADDASNYTTIVESQTNNLFEITIPYDIPSDGDAHAVDIQSFNLNATFGYYCAPKLDGDAFLVAKAIGWEQNILLSGNANIFFEGSFVGKTYIDVQNTNDTIELSLGRDKNVVVKRKSVKEFTEKKIIGGSKKELFVYELSIRNKKKQRIEINIEDQLPLSSHEDIKVELTESSNANYNKETGTLSWRLSVPSNEEKKLKMSYSVQFPKDKRVLGL